MRYRFAFLLPAVFVFLVFLAPYYSPQSHPSAAELPQFFTIQTGSYSIQDAAEKKYALLAGLLEEVQRDHLRIEKVGEYYTVRLGRFEARDQAETLLGAAGDFLAGAIVLQAYIKPERITRLYEIETEPAPAPAAEEQDQTGGRQVPGVTAEPDTVLGETVVAAGETDPDPVAEAEVQPETGAAAAAPTAVVEPRPENGAGRDLGAESEGKVGAGSVILDQGEKFYQRGQPNGLSRVKVVKVFSNDIYGNKISYPKEVHYDSTMDEIYMLSSGGQINTRITIYGPDYFPVAALGEGRGILNPMGLTVDKLGNIYVAQGSSHEEDAGGEQRPMIRVLNAAFFKMHDIFFDAMPGIPPGFVPQHLALGLDNNGLYVTGSGNTKGVLVLDLEGNFRRWLVPMKIAGNIEELGDDPSHLDALAVSDVVVDSKGRIYLLCFLAGRIFVLDKDENFLFAFGELGGTTGKLSNPRSIAVDVQRQAIYVIDYMRHTVNIYDYKSGRYLLEFGGQGTSPGWFQFPVHVAVDRRGNVIVADMFNHRVQIFDVP